MGIAKLFFREEVTVCFLQVIVAKLKGKCIFVLVCFSYNGFCGKCFYISLYLHGFF